MQCNRIGAGSKYLSHHAGKKLARKQVYSNWSAAYVRLCLYLSRCIGPHVARGREVVVIMGRDYLAVYRQASNCKDCPTGLEQVLERASVR